MDQASPDVHTETEKPQDQQNNENCPKHVNLLRSTGERPNVILEAAYF
jgi:hypothetical protein